jgi:hypothetical protein
MTAFDGGADWALAIENLATYDSARRAIEAGATDPPAALIFGRGNHFTASCASLPERLPGVRTLLYFGDLDRRGLEIPLAVRAALPGIDVRPWAAAYEALLACEPIAAEGPPVPRATAVALARFLPEGCRGPAVEVLAAGRRVPQEAVGRGVLGALPA